MNKYLVLILLLCMGCATSLGDNIRLVIASYDTVVFEDGINLEEAKIIAQNQLVKNNFTDIYIFLLPKVEVDIEVFPDYEDYWFIYFEEKRPSTIPFIFMVVINKQTGKVKFANDYNVGNTWILEADLLR